MSLLLYTQIRKNITEKLPLRKDTPRFYPWTQMVNRVRIDEIDPFHYTLVCEPIEKIKKLDCQFTWAQMCEWRTLQLLTTIPLDRKVYVMWSGGIDSSTVLLSLMLFWPRWELERIEILCSWESVVEFPEMWDLIVKKFRGRIHTSFNHPEHYLKDGSYIITGEHGDQLLGSDIIKKVVHICGEEAINKPWSDVMPKVYDLIFPDVDSKIFVERYESTIHESNYPIKTAFDWVWWFNFTNKWQHVKYRLVGASGWVNAKENFPRIIHFFDDPLWQAWSMNNPDKKIQNTLASYKFIAKEFILEHIKAPSYLSKAKLPSLSALWLNKDFCTGLNTDLEELTQSKCLEYVRS